MWDRLQLHAPQARELSILQIEINSYVGIRLSDAGICQTKNGGVRLKWGWGTCTRMLYYDTEVVQQSYSSSTVVLVQIILLLYIVSWTHTANQLLKYGHHDPISTHTINIFQDITFGCAVINKQCLLGGERCTTRDAQQHCKIKEQNNGDQP